MPQEGSPRHPSLFTLEEIEYAVTRAGQLVYGSDERLDHLVNETRRLLKQETQLDIEVVHDLDNALLLLNSWLGRPVQLPVLIRNGAPPGELPPSQPSPRWHIILGGKARVGRPQLAEATDLERQLTVETYELGDGPLKLLFGDLPYQRVLALGKDDQPDRLAFYLPGSTVVPRRVAWH